MTALSETLLAWAAARGYQVGWGPATVLDTVRADFESRLAAGELDAGFVRDALPTFDFDLPSIAPLDWRVVVVIVPAPAHLVGITVGGRRLDAVLPPTYVGYRPRFERVRADLLTSALAGARLAKLDVPLKPLAARLGMVRYGRNNVTYAPTLGSYLQITAYATDAALPIADDWRPADLRLLDDCEACGVCEAICPTAAIRDDRVLLHAERCVTFANESFAPLPSWIPAAANQSLMGCLQCQQACPANPPLPTESTIVFSAEETDALLADSGASDEIWQAIRAKLAQLELTETSLVGRNLRLLLRSC